MDIKRLVLGIHDLNSWGGQERSNLEIFYRLNQHIPIELHAYTFNDSRVWPQLSHVMYSQSWTRPSLLKFHHYQIESYIRLQKHKKQQGTLIQSTGAALPFANVVQVQFVQKAWYEIKKALPAEPSTVFKNVYTSSLEATNLFHEKNLYTNDKKYIAISHSVKKELMEYYSIKNENIDVIYHGVDTNTFMSAQSESALVAKNEIRQKLNIPEDHLVLLTVGALNQRKGLHTVLDTLKNLIQNQYKQVTLIAVGGGNPQVFIEAAKKMEISSHIRLIEAQKNIVPYYHASDIFLFPSRYEPFGLVILEAMACGLAVVASSTAGASELITHNTDGILIDPNTSAQGIAMELSELIKDKNKLHVLKMAAQETAKKCTWDSVANRYFDFYKNL